MKRPHLPKINWRYALGELIVVEGILKLDNPIHS